MSRSATSVRRAKGRFHAKYSIRRVSEMRVRRPGCEAVNFFARHDGIELEFIVAHDALLVGSKMISILSSDLASRLDRKLPLSPGQFWRLRFRMQPARCKCIDRSNSIGPVWGIVARPW